MVLTEYEEMQISDWMVENFDPQWCDDSFSHEFGTEVNTYWVWEIPEDCPYTEDEIAEVCDPEWYKIDFEVNEEKMNFIYDKQENAFYNEI